MLIARAAAQTLRDAHLEAQNAMIALIVAKASSDRAGSADRPLVCLKRHPTVSYDPWSWQYWLHALSSMISSLPKNSGRSS